MKVTSLILCGFLALAGDGCKKHPQAQGAPRLEYMESSTPQQYVQFYSDNFCRQSTFEWTQLYRVGMTRDEVRRILGADHLVTSLAYPATGWQHVKKDDYGVGQAASGFETDHPNIRVAVCDVYHAAGGWHILFFDSAGILVGFERNADGLIYYGSIDVPDAAA
jgi:hypothetical protein